MYVVINRHGGLFAKEQGDLARGEQREFRMWDDREEAVAFAKEKAFKTGEPHRILKLESTVTVNLDAATSVEWPTL